MGGIKENMHLRTQMYRKQKRTWMQKFKNVNVLHNRNIYKNLSVTTLN